MFSQITLFIKPALVALLLLNLSSCGGSSSSNPRKPTSDTISIKGSVSLQSSDGQALSWEGAKAEISGIEESFKASGKTTITLATATVDMDGSTRITVNDGEIIAQNLYAVKFTCPLINPGSCDVNTPIHIVLSGEQIKLGDWQANILTEIIYQKVSYYVKAKYTSQQMASRLDRLTNWLLKNQTNTPLQYNDLLNWRAETSSNLTLRKPDLVDSLVESVASGTTNTELQIESQKILDPALNQLDLPGVTNSAAFSHQYAYLANTEGLHIVNRSPEKLELINTFENLSNPISVAYQSGFAYIAEKNAFKIVDVQDPNNPALVSDTAIEEIVPNAYSFNNNLIGLYGNYAYIGTQAGIEIFNISDPKNILKITTSPIPPTWANSINVLGDYAYISNGNSVRILELTNPENPKLLPAGEELHFSQDKPGAIYGSIKDGFAFIALGPQGIRVIDYNNLENITEHTLDTFGFARFITFNQSNAFVLDGWANSILVYDFSNPIDLYLITRFSFSFPIVTLEVSEETAWVVDESSIKTLDISHFVTEQPTNVAQIEFRETMTSIQIRDDFAYASVGKDLYTIDLKEPHNPKILLRQPTEKLIYGLDLFDDNLYVSNDHAGLQVVDVSNSASPVFGYLYSNEPNYAISTTTLKSHLYQANGPDGVRYFDNSNPREPLYLGSLSTSEFAEKVLSFGDYLYIADTAGLLQVDLSSPNTPSETDIILAYDTSRRNTLSLARKGTTLFNTSEATGLKLHDISDPANPTPKEFNIAGLNPTVIAINGNHAYVGEIGANLQILDITDINNPRLIGSADLIGTPRALAFKENLVYVATTYGLEVLKALPNE